MKRRNRDAIPKEVQKENSKISVISTRVPHETPHQTIRVIRHRHFMGSVALPDCSAEAVSERA